MTDPIDHPTRLREIEARLERRSYTINLATADLRYLLDRVRELEAAVFISWRVYDRFGHWQCGHCGMDEMEDRHAPSCIVLTLDVPAVRWVRDLVHALERRLGSR